MTIQEEHLYSSVKFALTKYLHDKYLHIIETVFQLIGTQIQIQNKN